MTYSEFGQRRPTWITKRTMIQIMFLVVQNLIYLHRVDSSFVPSTLLSPRSVAGATTTARAEEITSTAENNINDKKEELLQHNEVIRVIYESENILAIDKPAHISHHDDPTYMGIVSHVRQLQKEKEIPYQGRLWGVHRLDRVTSGILLFAKSKEVAQTLAEAFRKKKVVKYYVALTNKKAKKRKQGWVKGDMMPSRRKTWKLCTTLENPAVTRFFTAGLGNCMFQMSDFVSNSDEHDVTDADSLLNVLPKTMILFRPHTGKTHQLRVAAKSVGIPILGDIDYSDANQAKYMKRAYLHAAALQVNLFEEKVVIYNPPTSWYCNETEEGNGMGDVFRSIMRKHCESEDILKLM